MDSQRWNRINELFYAACERDPAEREPFLEDPCAGDASLYEEFRALLDEDQHAQSRLDGVVLDAVSVLDDLSMEGKRGNHEQNPNIQRAARWVTLPGDDKPGPINIGDEDLSHMAN